MADHRSRKRTWFTPVGLPVVSSGTPGSKLPAVSRGKRAAYTLVELLTVIGIIAVLLGILLPVLTKAREGARRAACASNIRQLCAIQIMYAGDHKGVFIDASGPSQYYPYHIDPNVMNLFQTNYQLQRLSFYCPSNLEWDTDANWFDSSGLNVIGYVFLGGQAKLSQPKQTVLTYYSGFEEVPAGSLVFPRKLDDYTAFYQVLVTDLTRSIGNNLTSGGGSNHVVANDSNPTGYMPNGSGGANVGYMDGHVEWHPQSQMGQSRPYAEFRQFYYYDPTLQIYDRFYW